MTSSVALLGALGVVLAALIGGLVTWMVAKRATSGNVESSTARDLWDESNAMRTLLTEERAALALEVRSLKDELKEAVAAITSLNREIRQSRDETAASREETRQSRAETQVLMSQIADLHVETRSVLHEVKTANALTMGQLADNDESRRIDAIPKDQQTVQEQEHLRTASDRLPDNLRAKRADEKDSPA